MGPGPGPVLTKYESLGAMGQGPGQNPELFAGRRRPGKSRDLFFPENKGPCQEKPLLAHDLKKRTLFFQKTKAPARKKPLLAHDFKKGPSVL